MDQWFDETLVSIQFDTRTNKYKVVELPARATRAMTAKRRFATEELAEQYVDDQYAHIQAIAVQAEDIREEITRRKAIIAKVDAQEQAEPEPYYEMAHHHWEERRAIERDWPVLY